MSEPTPGRLEQNLIDYLDRASDGKFPEHDCVDVWADQAGGCKSCRDICAAVAAETEHCAKVAEEWTSEANVKGDSYGYDLMRSIAAAIRRGEDDS